MKILIDIAVLLQFIPIINIYPQSSDGLDTSNLGKSANLIRRHTEVLSSDNFDGRGTGTTGGSLAAKYISSEFAKYGLTPVGEGNSFYQNIPMHGSYPLKTSELKIYSGEADISLQLEKDYLLYKSGQQTFIPAPLELVFVGYGIIAPEFDYNDYQSIDVEGKIVVFIDGEPESDNPEFFHGEVPTIYSYPAVKQRTAFSRGAAGSIEIPDLRNLDWSKKVNDFMFEDISLAYSASNNLSVMIKPTIAEVLFHDAEYTFSQVVQMRDDKKILSFPLNAKISFRGEYIQRDFLSQNVIGMIEGRDPKLKDTYLLISAHYDHLGIGPSVKGDSIYNGTLDNAIGVSVLLELAKTFTELTTPPKRSIVFLSLTGEEKGLLGSLYYIDNPLVPLYKTIADINIDGIAFFRDFESIVGIGSEYSTLEIYLNETASRFNLTVEGVPPEFNQFAAFNQSDQVSFAYAGVPSILVLEGLINKNKNREEVLNAFIDYILNRYHSPFDDLSQDIDYVAAAQHANVLFDLVFTIVNSEDTPEWKSGSPFVNARLRSIAEKK